MDTLVLTGTVMGMGMDMDMDSGMATVMDTAMATDTLIMVTGTCILAILTTTATISILMGMATLPHGRGALQSIGCPETQLRLPLVACRMLLSRAAVPGATLVASESHHRDVEVEDRRASSPSVVRHDLGGTASPGHSARDYENVAMTESTKDVALEMDNTVPEVTSAPPPSTTPAATPILETAMNVD
ncbi:hypothetical protein BGZ88_007561 [Linnemannia elongata]|nr:hypothetical protein BGZ88_007561 [Linnemannia elongata]